METRGKTEGETSGSGARKGEAGRSRPRVRTATATATATTTATATATATSTATATATTTATATRRRLRRRVYPRPGALGRLKRMRKATRDDARCADVHGEAARAGRGARANRPLPFEPARSSRTRARNFPPPSFFGHSLLLRHYDAT